MLVRLVAAGLVALAVPAWAGEKLVYAVVHKGADYRAVRTDLFAVHPETAKSQIIFSDEKTSIVLLARLYAVHFPVARGRKVFGHAAERGTPVPFPGNGSLYELSSDGAHSFRRITPVSGAESLGEILVNSAGTRIGYINRLKQRQYVFIHDVETGRLVRQLDVTDILLDSVASTIGWLPRGEKLFLSLEAGDADGTSEESHGRVGTYFMDEDGEHPTKLGALPAREGFWPPETERMIGVLPTGEYVLETMQHKRHTAREPGGVLFAVLKLHADSGRVEDIGFSPQSSLYSGRRVSYHLSPSGKYLAAAAVPVSSSATSEDVWVKDIQTGTEGKLLSVPTEGLQGPFLGLVGWIDQ
jgi:hypothetical protein